MKSLGFDRAREQDYINDISHEFRTPLASIRGNAEVALFEGVPEETRTQAIRNVLHETNRLTNVLESLIELETIRTERGEVEMVDLRETCLLMRDALSHRASARRASVTIDGTVSRILGNPRYIKTAIGNVLENAIRFARLDGLIQIQLREADGFAFVEIADDGQGVSEESLDLIFDAFYRSDFGRARTDGGAGLGLTIVKSIMENHRGYVSVRNKPQGGACFLLAFPSIEAFTNDERD